MLEKIRELIGEAMEDLSAPKGRDLVSGGQFGVLPTESAERGHFSTNAAFVLALSLSKGGEKVTPVNAAEELKKYLEEKNSDLFSKIEVAEPGFLNFWLKPEVVRGEFKKIVEAGVEWGETNEGRGDTVIVEYSSPNIAKPMHVGHLRSTIIGDALANIYEFLGYKTVRWNYIGDWGTQFGKLIAAYKLWGKKEEVEKEPIKTLVDLYVRFHQELRSQPDLDKKGQEEFKKLEEGDKENRELWQWFMEESIKEFEGTYKLLGIKFDVWRGESPYEKELKPLIKSLLDNGIARESEGGVIVPLDEYNLPPGLIQKSDGATLYLTRDIASLRYRIKEYRPRKIVYVVGNEQALFLQQVFAIGKILGFDKAELVHAKYGMVLDEKGKKFSTREGETVPLEDLMERAIQRARKIMEEKAVDMSEEEKEEVAKIVGIGALKYNDLSQNRVADIAFDWDKMLSLQGNSAPYLQYTYARLRSILRKAGDIPKLETAEIEKEADLRLILKLAYFPEAIKAASENYLPHQITNYLYDLARAINDYYEKEPILKAEESLRGARLNLVNLAAETLKTGLSLLGIKTVERM